MTKKDYIKIAGIIKAQPGNRLDLAKAFCAMPQNDNPRFDQNGFFDYIMCEK